MGSETERLTSEPDDPSAGLEAPLYVCAASEAVGTYCAFAWRRAANAASILSLPATTSGRTARARALRSARLSVIVAGVRPSVSVSEDVRSKSNDAFKLFNASSR